MAVLIFTWIAPFLAAQVTISTLVHPESGSAAAGHSVKAKHVGLVASKLPDVNSTERVNFLANKKKAADPELDILTDVASDFEPQNFHENFRRLQTSMQASQGSKAARSKAQAIQKPAASKTKARVTQSSKTPEPKVQPKSKIQAAQDIKTPKPKVPAAQGSMAPKPKVQMTQDINTPKPKVPAAQGSVAPKPNVLETQDIKTVRPKVQATQGGTSLNPEAQVGPAHVTQDSVDLVDSMDNFLDESGSNDAEQLKLSKN